MLGGGKKNKKKKKLKKLKHLATLRRTHIIIEARKCHERNRKKLEETLSKGGFAEVASMEEQDIAFAMGAGAAKAVVMAGKTIEKLKKRQRSVNKSKSSHLSRLKKARKQMKGKSKTR